MMQQIHEHFAHNFFHSGVRLSPLADSPKHMKQLKDDVISEIKTELDSIILAKNDEARRSGIVALSKRLANK